MRLIDYLAKPDTREFLAVFHEVNSIELMQHRFRMYDEWDNENPYEWQNAACDIAEDIDRLEVGHAAWIGLSLHWGLMGIMVGGIIALVTAPKGFYVN